MTDANQRHPPRRLRRPRHEDTRKSTDHIGTRSDFSEKFSTMPAAPPSSWSAPSSSAPCAVALRPSPPPAPPLTAYHPSFAAISPSPLLRALQFFPALGKRPQP